MNCGSRTFPLQHTTSLPPCPSIMLVAFCVSRCQTIAKHLCIYNFCLRKTDVNNNIYKIMIPYNSLGILICSLAKDWFST